MYKKAGIFLLFLLTFISQYDIVSMQTLSHYDISYQNIWRTIFMDAHTRKVYVPMTETGFYILFCLQKPNHGYGVVQMTEKLTDGEIRLAPGTMYGSLSKMEKDGLIRFVSEEDKRKIYQITELGTEVLQLELKRIQRLYRTSQEVI